MESIKDEVENWVKGHKHCIFGPKADLIKAARTCSRDLKIKASTADKYIRDIKIEWNNKYGPDKIIPKNWIMDELKFDSDYEVDEEQIKAYLESDIVERVEKKFPKKNLEEIKLDYEKYEEDLKKMKEEIPVMKLQNNEIIDESGKIIGMIGEKMEGKKFSVKGKGLCITHVTCFGTLGKIEIGPNGVYQQVPKYRGENGEYIPVDNITYKNLEDLENYYEELKKCFEIKELLNLKFPEKKER